MDRYLPSKFYKGAGHNPNYAVDLEKYKSWLEECWTLVREATRAANWFADVVRRDINPMFFAERGRFVILEGPFEDLQYYASIPEFTEQQKASMPAVLAGKTA